MIKYWIVDTTALEAVAAVMNEVFTCPVQNVVAFCFTVLTTVKKSVKLAVFVSILVKTHVFMENACRNALNPVLIAQNLVDGVASIESVQNFVGSLVTERHVMNLVGKHLNVITHALVFVESHAPRYAEFVMLMK